MATLVRIQRKAGIRWKAIIKDRKGRPLKSKTFTRKGDAKTWAKRIEADREAMRALGTPGAAIDLQELADEYFRKWKGKDISRVARVGWWVDRIGDEKLIDIDQDLIRRHLKAYSAGKAKRGNGRGQTKGQTAKTTRSRSPATINRMKAALSALLKFAVNEGYLNTNPARSLSQKTEDSEKHNYLT